MVDELFEDARRGADTAGQRVQLKEDTAGQRVVAWLGKHCECLTHASTKKALIRLLLAVDCFRGWPLNILRVIVDCIPLHELTVRALSVVVQTVPWRSFSSVISAAEPRAAARSCFRVRGESGTVGARTRLPQRHPPASALGWLLW